MEQNTAAIDRAFAKLEAEIKAAEAPAPQPEQVPNEG